MFHYIVIGMVIYNRKKIVKLPEKIYTKIRVLTYKVDELVIL
jgi:hypothetical protein